MSPGSVLGPLLFLYINDLERDLANPCFKFADDVKFVGMTNQGGAN